MVLVKEQTNRSMQKKKKKKERERPKIDPHKYSQLILTKEQRQHDGETTEMLLE